MRVLIVPNEPNPNMTGRHYGLAKSLLAAGHEVHTVVWDLPQIMSRPQLIRHMFTSLFTKQYAYEDLTIHKIGRLPLFWPIINGWLFKNQIRRLFKILQIEVIISQSYTNETTIPKELPFIYDLADDYYAPAEVFGSLVYKVMFRLLGVQSTMRKQCISARAVTAVSDVLCSYARQYNNKVFKLPNGVESDIIGVTVADKSIKIKPHSLIYVTGFGPWSQPIKVMEAVRSLRKEFPDITLTLVGEGSEVSKIKEYIANYNAGEYIYYKGFVHDRAEVFRLIAKHEIGLNISEKNRWRDAAHPMKVIEYSALGKKVVSTGLEGVKNLNLSNVTMFTNDNDGENLRMAIRVALLAKPLSKQATTALSRSIIEEYSWSIIVTSLKQIVTDNVFNSKLNIVHVTPSYLPTLGGLEKVVNVLAETQQTDGISVSVITADHKNTVGTDFIDAVPVTRLNSFVIANTTIMPALFTTLMRLTERQYVHLHVTQAFTPEVVWLTAKIKHYRYIAHIHLDVPPSGMAGFLLGAYKSLILRRVLHGAEYVVVFTKDQRIAVTKKYGLKASRVVIIPNGVEDKYFYAKPRKLHALPRLLFVGRLGYQKNVALLLLALQGVSERYSTTIVGDGELRQDLEAMTKKLKLRNVLFAGRADGSDLYEYYRHADIFVLPSEREGMPLVLLEALAMGLPIVATDVTGSHDVIKNMENGLLVPADNAQKFREALEKVSTDRKLYQMLHVCALHSAEQYSWHTVAQRFEALYKETI